HVGVAPDVDVIVLVTAHDRTRPDRRALLDDDVADHLRGGIDPRARMDPRRAAGHGPDHRRGSAATGSRAALTARLSAATTSGGRAAMSRAHAVASSISSSYSFRSAPPQKARSPAPVSTTARAPVWPNSVSASRMPRRLSSLSTFIGGLSSSM